jgi:hypothetical protein
MSNARPGQQPPQWKRLANQKNLATDGIDIQEWNIEKYALILHFVTAYCITTFCFIF